VKLLNLNLKLLSKNHH